MQQFVSVEEARVTILASVSQMPAERAPLSTCLGRTLAEEVVSRDAIPPFDNSAMDGYAVRAEDLAEIPATLCVIQVIHAGTFSEQAILPGTCARIMTGAPMPPGADTVVPVEWTEEIEEGRVIIQKKALLGASVRRAGGDVQRGATVFRPGEVITPPVVGMLAAIGCADVAVQVRPRVAIIATGDELVEPGQVLGPGQIRNSNGPALAAQVASAGGEVQGLFVARDEPASIRAILEEALHADVIVLSGGVSVGEHDYVKDVLDEMGMEILFWKVRQRPGKPLAYGVLNGTPIFGLPGNPVSSSVCFEQYVRPALAKMLGRTEIVPELHHAVLDASVSKRAGLHYFARGTARVDEHAVLRAAPTGSQDSNVYTSMVQANCLIHLPEKLEDPPAGTPVQIEWLRW